MADIATTTGRAPSVDPALADSWTVAGADGVAIRVYGWKSNTGARPAVLWGHANGFAAGAYAPLLSELGQRFDVFAYDLRCHGGSADPGAGGDYDHIMTADRIGLDTAAVVASARRQTPFQPLHFAGHSVSGLGALRMGAVFGLAPFRSMTVFEPPLAPTPDQPLHGPAAAMGELLAGRALKRRRDVSDPDSFAESLSGRPAFARWRRDMLSAFAHATLTPAENGEGWRLRCPPEAEAAVYRMTMDVSTFAALKSFDRPILFVESDPAIQGPAPSWAIKAQGVASRQAPRGRLQRVEQTSHMMPFERPEAIIEIVAGQVAGS